MTRFPLIVIATIWALMVVSAVSAQGLPDFAHTRGGSVAEPAPKVRVSAAGSRAAAGPGEPMAIAVTMEFSKGWHAWPGEGQDVLPPEIDEFAIRTTLTVAGQPGVVGAVGRVQWPTPMPASVPDFNRPGATIDVPTFKDRVTIYVPILIASDAKAGGAVITATLGYQACNDRVCEQEESVELRIAVEIRAEAVGGEAVSGDVFAGFDTASFDRLRAGESATPAPSGPARSRGPATGSKFFGVSLSGLTGPVGFLFLALLGAVGGFILNLTPCVLPVIPIKVLTLTKQAGSPGRSLLLGAFMAAGVVAFWLALGIPAAFVTALADPSRLFGIWWLTTGIGVLIAAMGLGILGLFSINLPQAVYLVNPETESPIGSFLFGVMTAVLGLPCFGFVAGALLPAAASIGSLATIVVFGAMGVGMALPYLVLAAKPQWVERLPRTGPASELVKQVMGLLLLAASSYFIGSGLLALVQEYPFVAKRLHWWFAAAFALAAGGWLIVRTIQITPNLAKRAVFGMAGLMIAGAGIGAAWSLTAASRDSRWVAYDEASVQRALAGGQTVVMDFTAEWCINCKAMKAAVLSVSPVKPVLAEPGVALFEVDLTSKNAPGWKKLNALGQTGIPLLVIQGPGLEEPWMSNAYTSRQVLDALASARGKAGE